MANISAIKIKIARHIILTNLNIICPTPAPVPMLYHLIIDADRTYDMSLLRKDIWYLEQKGYIRFFDELGGNENFVDRMIVLTKTGKEIAEKTMTDPALEI